MKPLYKHDCNKCIFLGSVFDVLNKVDADLYCCPMEVSGPSILVRYSSDGPDYWSNNFEHWEKSKLNEVQNFCGKILGIKKDLFPTQEFAATIWRHHPQNKQAKSLFND